MVVLLQRFFARSEVALLGVFVVAVVLALLLGRWLAAIQEPPTRYGVGQRLLTNGRADEAAYLFEDHLWKGVALYRSGRYHRAVGEFVSDDSVTGYYNMGNAYAHLGLYEGAIAAYEVVLSRVPNHEDARYNLDLVREAQAREQELEDESRETEEAGDWQDGFLQEQQEAGGEPDPAAEEEDMPSSSDSASDEMGDGERTQSSQAPPSSNGASGSEQQGKEAEAESFTLTSGDEQDDTGLSPAADDLEERPVTPGEIDRLREEEMADEILLRRIEDNPALVLKARLSMALRKKEAKR